MDSPLASGNRYVDRTSAREYSRQLNVDPARRRDAIVEHGVVKQLQARPHAAVRLELDEGKAARAVAILFGAMPDGRGAYGYEMAS